MRAGRVFVPGKSQPQGSTKSFMVNGHINTTTSNSHLYSWRSDVHAVLRGRVGPTIAVPTGPLSLGIEFVLPRRAHEPKTVTPAHTRKPDLDKLIRACADAATGVLYGDDSQIDTLGAMKRTAAISEQPGMWLTWGASRVAEPATAAPLGMIVTDEFGRQWQARLVDTLDNGNVVLERVT